eukprot:GHVO01037399.1.p1 GENE.GHVO01037399.1~~GHVO01037399.1.p1  ORF type:complete len:159 (+),score=22.88 GHVO01037399.1:1441-1917(+)
MYLQVVILVEERDALSFWWFDESGNVVTYRMTRHLFEGIWFSNSSTFADDCDLFDAVNFVIHWSFYVDDYLHSMDSEEDLIRVALGVKETLRRGGFMLTEFVSSSASLMSVLPAEECGMKHDGKEFTSESKVLGMTWDVEKDVKEVLRSKDAQSGSQG